MKVAVVCGICVDHDAISGAASAQAEMLAGMPGIDDVVLIAQYHGRSTSVRTFTVTDPWTLAVHPELGDADLVVFHWGIKYELFDAIPIVERDRRVVVHFHNVTPAHLVAPDRLRLIEESVIQMHAAACSSARFWTESEFNIATLHEWGVEPDRVDFMPFPIEWPPIAPAAPVEEHVRMIAVGRLVPAKGLGVLVEAMEGVATATGHGVHMTVAGTTAFSDHGFVDQLTTSIERRNLRADVQLVEAPTTRRLAALYRRSHVVVSASLHEGLCVPVIEGYRAGCRAIGTDAGNLPFVVQAPDPIVAAGEPEPLAQAIITVADEVRTNGVVQPSGVQALIDTYSRRATRVRLEQAIAALA